MTCLAERYRDAELYGVWLFLVQDRLYQYQSFTLQSTDLMRTLFFNVK